MTELVRIERPRSAPVPLVFDSPHSGSIYPDDFDHVIDRMTLRRSEDAYIDQLFGHAPEFGATLVHALFPRCYIDPNRNEDDIDVTMLSGPWPESVNPTSKTLERGVGLVWKRMRVLGEIYDRQLSPAELSRRIETCWRPYHATLAGILNKTREAHGVVYHIDCHSMSSRGDAQTEDGPVRRPDFVIGDRDGTTCDKRLTECVVETLRAAGHSVAINYPYKGFEIVRRYGRPVDGRHSIQIEVNRGLYMSEATLSKSEGFLATEHTLRKLTQALADFAAGAKTA